MAIGNSNSLENPKPTKPIAAEMQKISLGISGSENRLTAEDFNRKLNFALEVLKFFPDWKNQKYEGENGEELVEEAVNQFAPSTPDGDGNAVPTFGQVLSSMKNNVLSGANLGGLTKDIEFYDTAGDYDHVQDDVDNDISEPLTEGLTPELWSEVKTQLEDADMNYYEMMMNGIDDLSSQEAFYLMVGMLESRTRVMSTLEEMYGTSAMSDEERAAKFQNFLAKYEGQIDEKKLALLTFPMDTKQSFISTILPMFGGTDEYYNSELDKEKVQEFFNDLSAKVNEYIGLANLSNMTDEELAKLSEDQQTAIQLWNQWVNPEGLSELEENIDPASQNWGETSYKKIGEYVDKVINNTIVQRISERSKVTDYKEKMQKWEEKEEEMQQEEIDKNKREAKAKAERKALESRSTAKNKQQSATSDKQMQKANTMTKTTGLNKTRYTNSEFRALLNKIASRVQSVSNKTKSTVSAAVTPGKTVKLGSGTSRVTAASTGSRVAPATGNTRVRSRTTTGTTPASNTPVKKATETRKTAIRARTTPKSSGLGTSTAAKLQLSRSYTAQNIKAKAPKQKKD